MALFLKVRDNRWQFSFGSKYMVIADVLTDVATTYVAGGTPISLAVDPQVKASRAPWFAAFNSTAGYTAAYIPDATGGSNSGTIKIFLGGVEVTGSITLTQGQLQGMFIFQGME